MRGFSLIELLITMAIMALLAALALPGYSGVMRRALRQDARLALLRVQYQQEISFAKHLTYAPQPEDAGAMLRRSEQGLYLLEVGVSADGMSYTAVAHADPAGRQAGDAHCAQLAIDSAGRRRSADSASLWRDDDPYRCWG